VNEIGIINPINAPNTPLNTKNQRIFGEIALKSEKKIVKNVAIIIGFFLPYLSLIYPARMFPKKYPPYTTLPIRLY